ncbi:MAG TPA: phosphotransferase [Roseiflexaceae bacterium]|nr:phosphotransferase [Roseiflexaceae bacterium]
MTVSNQDEKFVQLAHMIAPQGKLRRTWQLSGGISASMTALEIEQADGQVSRLIIRQPSATTLQRNPHAAEQEYVLLRLMRAAGLATPTPYYLDQSGAIFRAPYLAIEYVEGRPEFAFADMAGSMRQLARQLAQIHSVDCATLDLSFLPRPAAGFADRFGNRPAQPDRSLEEGRIRDTLEAAWPFPQRNAPALLHGDYWPGNILWRDAQLAAVIDWEDATVGDPLIDFAISRLDLLWIFGAEAMHNFTQQYQSLMEIDYGNLPYWDLCAALRLIRLAGADLTAWAAFFEPFGRPDITEQSIRAHYRWFIAQAFEVLAH